METYIFQDGSQIKRQKNINNHNASQGSSMCNLLQPAPFSLVPTFKQLSSRFRSYFTFIT